MVTSTVAAIVHTICTCNLAEPLVTEHNRIAMSDLQERRDFLSSLHEAVELSIILTDHRCPPTDPVEMEEGVFFRLEISSSSTVNKRGSSAFQRKLITSFVDREGTSKSSPIWSNCPSNPILSALNTFLCTLQEHQDVPPPGVSSFRSLRWVTLQGCGRIPNFYHQLIAILSRKATFLKSLSILDWGAFIASDLPEDAVIQHLFSRLHNFHIELLAPSIDVDGPPVALALLHMPHLRTLKIEMQGLPAADCDFWEHMGHALTNLPRLQELQWISSSCSPPSCIVKDGDNLLSLCSAIGSRKMLQSLELSWPVFLGPNHLAAMLPERSSPLVLTSLTVEHVHKGCADVLGRYLTHNKTLQALRISFHKDCGSSSAVDVMERALRHPRITSLSLFGVDMDNDTSKTLQMACVYNTTLARLQVSARGIETWYLEDIFLGLKLNTTLRYFDLRNADDSKARIRLDTRSCSALCDVLEANATLRRLSLKVELPTSPQCALQVARAIRSNATLKSLSGIYYLHAGETPRDEQVLFSIAVPE